jgi:protein disulfide-isomerase
MIRIVILLAVFAAALTACNPASVPPTTATASDKEKENGKAKEKLAWTENLDAALAQAKEQRKPVLIDFTGSTWCPPCIELNKEVFSTARFQEYVQGKFILVKVDFPDPVDLPPQKMALAEKYMPEVVFPTIVILDSDGKKLGQTGFAPGGPEPFIAAIEQVISKK